MTTLHCEAGDHSWERPSQRGRKPLNCPDHKPSTPEVETLAVVPLDVVEEALEMIESEVPNVGAVYVAPILSGVDRAKALVESMKLLIEKDERRKRIAKA